MKSRHDFFLCILMVMLHVLAFSGAPAWSKELHINLEEALKIALEHNEIMRESAYRIAESEAGVTSAYGPYDTTLFANTRHSAYNSLSSRALNAPSNATKNYLQSDGGLRQRINTGGSVSLYLTHSNESRLGYEDTSRKADKTYLTLEFTQSLLRGIGDKEQRGAIEKALLTVDNSLLDRKLAVSQLTLEVIRAYWGLVLAQESLRVGNEIREMAQEVLRREEVRLSRGLSRGVDVDRAQLAVQQRDYTVLQQTRDIEIAQERLFFLLNDPRVTEGTALVPVTQLGNSKTDATIPQSGHAKSLALTSRYELKQIELLLKQIHIDFSTAKNNMLPYLDLQTGVTSSNGNTYLRSAERFQDTDESGSWYVGLSVTYPLQNREAKGALQRQNMLLKITTQQLGRTTRQISEQVQEALYNLTAAQQGILVASKALSAAQRTMDGEFERFEMGVVNNRDLLASHDALGREKISHATSLANYKIFLAEYEYATAGLLDKYLITVYKDQVKIQ